MAQSRIAQTHNRFGELWEEIRAAEDLPAYRMELARMLAREFPQYYIVWVTLGNAMMDVSRLADAEDAFQRMMETHGETSYWRAYLEMGKLCRGRGDNTRAESWFRRAIETQPRWAGAYVYLGGLLATGGRLSEAEAELRQGISRNEGCIEEAYLNLGDVMRLQGRYDEALACFDQALSIDPKYRLATEARLDVQRTMEAAAKTPDPIAHRREMDAEPLGKLVGRRWRETLKYRQFPTFTRQLLKAYVRDFPIDMHGWWHFGLSLTELLNYDEAKQAFQKAMDLAGAKVPALLLCRVGEMFKKKGEFPTAIEWYRRAIATHPNDATGHEHLARILLGVGDFSEAERVGRLAHWCYLGDTRQAKIVLGYALRAQERYTEALSFFDAVLKQQPRHREARQASRDLQRVLRLKSRGQA